MALAEIKKEIIKESNYQQSINLQRFFKTGKGEYGEGDIFLGIKVPIQRRIAKTFSDLSLKEVEELLISKIHEERLISLFILIHQFERGNEIQRETIYNFYLKNLKHVNNWDLVDSSAHKIVGAFLFFRDRKVLYNLAKSKNLWEKRVSIISTAFFIARNDFADTLKISKILLHDEHDLIQKAVGRMLREVGKRDLETEEEFLKIHYKEMPRTMLRYAIEKFPEKKRKDYLHGKI